MADKVDMKVVFNPDIVRRIVDKKMPAFLAAVGSAYTNDVKLSMRSSPRGGINVNSRGQRRSAPGEPPAPDTGDLIKSIRFQVRQIGRRWLVECGSTLRKAVYLEFGAARGRVMQARNLSGKFTAGKTMSWILYPRPAWGPAMLRLRRAIPDIVRRFSDPRPRKGRA
jgi:hypothetical protein